MRFFGLLAALFLGLAAFAPSSQAATVSYDVTFSATNFVGSGTPNLPVVGGSHTLQGAFRITFDPTQGYGNDASTISNFSINLPGFSSPVGLSFTPFLASGVVGGLLGGGDNAFNVASGTSDFHLAFTLGGLISEITFSALNTNGHFHKYVAAFPHVTVTQVAATPIPASLLMMLTSLGMLGGFGYLRGRKAQSGAMPLAAA